MPAPGDAKSIFCNALERSADRAAYLDAACGGDAALRAEVEELLRAHGGAADFLNDDPDATHTGPPPSAAPARTASHGPVAEAAGAVIGGRYKLLEPIGEGGMGSVWHARQLEPVKRAVAVKLIKAGMDSRAVLARFEAERQALALMDHPNIAKVLDADSMPDGRPFFVMELVKGVPITTFCDERNLSPRQRLELFVPVCRAIQHAHTKGVIHRDIKPSNVLVALYDDKPVPKVIDFGIAKAAGEPLTDKTINTGFGMVVGTLQYMAPEQAAFNNLDVDTRADVYGLGALLYELLTGSPPFTKAELNRAEFLEALRVIREDEPPKPSTRVSTAGGKPGAAAARGTDAGRLAGLLRSDLDWVVMKCLDKDRTRRYESAGGFAADVERYLAGEAVQAAPPSAAYRVRKFVRRHRAGVIAFAVLSLAFLIGATGTAVGLVRAARAEADAERTKGEAARAEAQAAEDRARREREARQQAQVLTAKLRQLLRAADPDEGGGPEMTVRQMLDQQVPLLWPDLTGRPEVEADLRLTVGLAYSTLIDPDKAVEHFEAAVRLRRTVQPPDPAGLADALTNLADARLQVPVNRSQPAAERREWLAKAAADDDEAVALLRGADADPALLAEALLNRASVVNARIEDQGQAKPDWEPYRAALREATDAVRRCPPGAGQYRRLARCHEMLARDFRTLRGDYPAAIREVEAALDYRIKDSGADHLYTARGRLILAGCYLDMRDHRAAEGHLRAALKTYDRVFGGRPNPYTSHATRSLVLALAWQSKDAELAALLPKYPADSRDQGFPGVWAVWAPLVWGYICLQRGDFADAEAHLQAALVEGEKRYPTSPQTADARLWLAIALAVQDKRREAAEVVRPVVAAARAVAAGGPAPADLVLPYDVPDALTYCVGVLAFAGGTDPKDAERALESSARRFAAVAARPLAERLLPTYSRAETAFYLNRPEAAVPLARELLAVTRADNLWGRMVVEHILADSLEKMGQLKEAEDARRAAVAFNAKELGEGHSSTTSRRIALAAFLVRQKRHADAIPELEKAFAALSKHPQAAERALAVKLFDVAARLAAAHDALGDAQKAAEWRKKVPAPNGPVPKVFWY